MKYVSTLYLILLFSVSAFAQRDVDSFAKAGFQYLDKEHLDSALMVARSLIDEHPYYEDGIKLYYVVAASFSYSEYYSIARKIYKDIINSYPKHWVVDNAYLGLGEIAYKEGDTTRAIYLLSNFVENKHRSNIRIQYGEDIEQDYNLKYIAYSILSTCHINRQEYQKALVYQQELDTILTNYYADKLCGTRYSVERGMSDCNYFDIYKGLGDTTHAISYIWRGYFQIYARGLNRKEFDGVIKPIYRKLLHFYDTTYIKQQALVAAQSVRLQPFSKGVYRVMVTLFGTEHPINFINLYGQFYGSFYDDMKRRYYTEAELLQKGKDYFTNLRLYMLLKDGKLE